MSSWRQSASRPARGLAQRLERSSAPSPRRERQPAQRQPARGPDHLRRHGGVAGRRHASRPAALSARLFAWCVERGDLTENPFRASSPSAGPSAASPSFASMKRACSWPICRRRRRRAKIAPSVCRASRSCTACALARCCACGLAMSMPRARGCAGDGGRQDRKRDAHAADPCRRRAVAALCVRRPDGPPKPGCLRRTRRCQ